MITYKLLHSLSHNTVNLHTLSIGMCTLNQSGGVQIEYEHRGSQFHDHLLCHLYDGGLQRIFQFWGIRTVESIDRIPADHALSDRARVSLDGGVLFLSGAESSREELV